MDFVSLRTQERNPIYERSIAGPWHNLLEKPVCGSSVPFGLNSPGRHHDHYQREALRQTKCVLHACKLLIPFGAVLIAWTSTSHLMRSPHVRT